jgi:tetratricopeptide (TPR) repeat protein
LPAAASLTGMTLPRVRTVLRELVEASLVERRADGRFAMHDLIRAYAASTVEPEAAEAALGRVLDFYLHTTHSAARLLDPHSVALPLDPPAPGVVSQPLPDYPAALAWVDAEYANLMAALHTASVLGRYRSVYLLAGTLLGFHYLWGRHRDRLAAWQAALDAATQLPSAATDTNIHWFLSIGYTEQGRHDEAIECLRQALASAENQQDVTDEAHTHGQLAQAWGRRGDHRQALVHAGRAAELYRGLDRPVWEARALTEAGWYAAGLGRYDIADAYCQAALARYREHPDPLGEAGVLNSIGYVAQHTGRPGLAVDHYQRALALYEELGHTYFRADILDRLGQTYVARGEAVMARAVWQEALELCREQGRDEEADRVRRQLDTLGKGDE